MATCSECRTPYTRVRVDQLFCSSRCLASAKNRELKRARVIYRAVYEWRLHRKTAGASLLFICREVAAWIKEDREHQRLPPPRHDHTRDRGLQTRRASTKEKYNEAVHL